MARTNHDQAHLRRLRDTYARLGCLPSYSQMAKAMGFKAKNAAYKLAQRLIDSGHLTKVAGGRLAPGPTFFSLDLSDDEVRAGFGADAHATGLMQAQALDQLLVSKPSRTLLVKVRGESMAGAGILSGDVAVVETQAQALHGDIVVAEMDGSHTIKELRIEHGRSRLLAHDGSPRAVAPGQNLNVIGVVRGIVRSYRQPPATTAKLNTRGALK